MPRHHVCFSIFCACVRWSTRLRWTIVRGFLSILRIFSSRGYTRRVLLVRPDALGDFLISTHAFQQLSEYFHSRGCRLILVHSEKTRTVGSASPWFDDRITIPNSPNAFARWKIYRKLAAIHAEYAVCMPCIFGADSLAVRLTIAANAHFSYGLIPQKLPFSDGNAHLQRFPSSIFRRIRDKLFTHDQYLALIEARNIHPYYGQLTHSVPAPNTSDVFSNEARLVELITGSHCIPKAIFPTWLMQGNADLTIKPPYCVIIPGSGNPARCWQPENFAAVIKKLHANHPEWSFAFVGITAEKPLADKIIGTIDAPNTNLCGKTSLGELVAILSQAALVIGNETGTTHLAAMTGTKTWIVTGGGHFGLYVPNSVYTNVRILAAKNHDCFHCNWLCTRMTNGVFPCIAEVNPDVQE